MVAKTPTKAAPKAPPAEPETCRLIELKLQNWMSIRALHIKANGHHVEISGPNGAGKTSTILGLWVLIKGLSSKQIPEPVTQDEDRATIDGDFGKFNVHRQIDEDGSQKLVVTSADGDRYSRPQEFLDGLLGNLTPMDVTAFLKKREQDQVDDVLAQYKVRPPVERVKEITGECHEAKPGESANDYMMRLSADETGLYYVERRRSGRDAEQKLHALEEQQQELAKLGGPLQEDEAAQSASEILTEIERLSGKAEERRTLIAASREAADTLGEAERLLDDYRAKQRAAVDERASLMGRIAALQNELVACEGNLEDLGVRIEKGVKFLADQKAEVAAAEAKVAAYPDPAPQIAARRQDLAELETRNKPLERRRLAEEHAGRLTQEWESAKAAHKAYDGVLEQLRHLRANLLDGVKLGVPGLSIGDGELRLNGVSFKQASNAERIRVACAVSMASNPKLRVVRLDNAESLDAESRKLLFALAKEMDFQCILTSVASRRKCSKCGEVRDDEPECPTCKSEEWVLDDGLKVEILEAA